ncbi:hypothetical protein MPH_12144 [Macrophomina phaseolina MS6]|uniref:Uncharacterized protein n=1 Tax=Macrophomina phaseolina (strain MS6) TaxID=1126212 RepID=K2QLN2_MACPH|nr:hypothetical protein MPH_12144 [Macrophomina phaseolina MS6]
MLWVRERWTRYGSQMAAEPKPPWMKRTCGREEGGEGGGLLVGRVERSSRGPWGVRICVRVKLLGRVTGRGVEVEIVQGRVQKGGQGIVDGSGWLMTMVIVMVE